MKRFKNLEEQSVFGKICQNEKLYSWDSPDWNYFAMPTVSSFEKWSLASSVVRELLCAAFRKFIWRTFVHRNVFMQYSYHVDEYGELCWKIYLQCSSVKKNWIQAFMRKKVISALVRWYHFVKCESFIEPSKYQFFSKFLDICHVHAIRCCYYSQPCPTLSALYIFCFYII